MGRWSNRCRNGNCSVGDETGVLDCELPSLLVDPRRGGVRLICECQAKIAGSSLGSDEILRGTKWGLVCARPPFGSTEPSRSHVVTNRFELRQVLIMMVYWIAVYWIDYVWKLAVEIIRLGKGGL